MKKVGIKPFNILSSNTHLVNILEKDYYVELGTVSIQALDKILEGEKVYLEELLYSPIVAEGVGKITDDASYDTDFQLYYIESLHAKHTSYKYALTCGLISYRTWKNEIIDAPVILIPISIDTESHEIFLDGECMINKPLIRLFEKNHLVKEHYKQEFHELINQKITSIYEIDTITKQLGIYTNSVYGVSNYLTLIDVEYPDFVYNKEYFKSEHSMTEDEDAKVLKEFYTNIHPVTLTNIEQKYIISKVHNKENIVVDGRIGTGKTTTILNIIADTVRNRGKVLYVNQDISAISKLHEELEKIYLGPTVYSFTTKVSENGLDTKGGNPHFDLDIIDRVSNIQNKYEKRYHGYPYSYIAEKVAIQKQKGIKETVPIKSILERHEIEDIYKNLKIIEDDFKYVDPFPENVYASLYSSETAPTIPEIKERVTKYSRVNKLVIEKLKEFSETYHISEIDTMREFNHLNNELLSFKDCPPTARWIEEDFTQEGTKAIREISENIDKYYNTLDYYKQICSTAYTPGIAKEILESITSDHYKIDSKESADIKYLDNLLMSGSNLLLFNNDVKKWSENSLSAIKRCRNYFGFQEGSEFEFYFYAKCHKFFSKYSIEKSWFLEYLNHHEAITSKNQIFREKLAKLSIIKKQMEGYFINSFIGYKEIGLIVKGKHALNHLKKFSNKVNLKKDHKSFSSLVSDVENYYELGTEIKNYLPSDTKKSLYNEDTWIQYAGFLNFVTSLTETEEEYLKHALKKYEANEINNIQEVYDALEDLSESIEESQKYILVYERNHLPIDKDNYYTKVMSMTSTIPYLEKVLRERTRLTSYFKYRGKITTLDILLLIEVDKANREAILFMNQNRDRFVSLFGKMYQGFDTNVTEIAKEMALFSEFSCRINRIDDIREKAKTEEGREYINNKFSSIAKEADLFINLYNEWLLKLRGFSNCFYKGKMLLLNKSLRQTDNLLDVYMSKLYQVDKVMDIEYRLDGFYKYGFGYLAEGIQEGKYKEGIAEEYFYQTMRRHYLEIVKNDHSPFTRESITELRKQYSDEEKAYTLANIQYFKDSIDPKKPALLKLRDTDTNLNRYTQKLKQAKNYSIILCDLNTFVNITNPEDIDLLIIDDSNLTTANKFNNLYLFKQTVIFGDRSFQSSITNTLLQRMNSNAILTLHKRYIGMNTYFDNTLTANNCYIYDPTLIPVMKSFHSINEIAQEIVNRYTSTLATVNVIVFNKLQKRVMFSKILSILKETYSFADIEKIFNTKINIIVALLDAAHVADYTYFVYNYLLVQESSEYAFIKNNYLFAKKATVACAIVKQGMEKEDPIYLQAKEFIGENKLPEKRSDGIIKLIIDCLNGRGIKAVAGIGEIDIIVGDSQQKKGISIVGKRTATNYSCLDDYIYYVNIYREYGWNILIYCIEDLLVDFNKVIDEIVKQLGDKND